MKFNKNCQIGIFRILSKEWDKIFDREQNEQPLKILQKIWSVKDDQSGKILEDVLQHFFRNNDWTTEYLFVNHLKIYESDLLFQSFIESILAPENFLSSDQLTTVSVLVDDELAKDKLKLVTSDFDERGFPIQHVELMSEDNDLPPGVKKNDIPFYLMDVNSNLTPSEERYFTLYPNKTWNDFSVVSKFSLHYHSSPYSQINIGNLKIIYLDELVTYEHLPKKFTQLSEDFCSLSIQEDYYFDLQTKLGQNELISVLYALQDAAYFPEINDRFEKNSSFVHSIMRDNAAERMLRNIKAILKGHDLSESHSFKYKFKPAYSEDPIEVSFDFNELHPVPSRIFAVIGKNGTGKTQLVTAIPNSFANNSSEDFFGKLPSFSKIIAVSYSVFDTFKVPRRNATFNYVYCGLKDEAGGVRTDRGLTLSFHNNWKKIDEMRRTDRWRKVLYNFIDEQLVDTLITKSSKRDKDFEISLDGFHSIKNKLSSGQSILLYIITQVVANIRVDSLIIYDEPETHLHPNAIVELMNTIYELVNEFESFCLIATHSPIVIRELFSKNVFVLEREGTAPSIKRIGIESFGENLGILTDEVFGDRQVPKQYKKIIGGMIDRGLSYEIILSTLEFDEVPLSLNARIYISNLINARNEEF